MVLESIDIITQMNPTQPQSDAMSDAVLSPTATSEDARNIREARDAMQAFTFFSSAIAAQMSELYAKLAHVEVATSSDEFYGRLAAMESEREAARSEAKWLRTQMDQVERDAAHMREELERQRISFADHHAAKQEIAKLRAEVDQLQQPQAVAAGSPELSRRWRLNR